MVEIEDISYINDETRISLIKTLLEGALWLGVSGKRLFFLAPTSVALFFGLTDIIEDFSVV